MQFVPSGKQSILSLHKRTSIGYNSPAADLCGSHLNFDVVVSQPALNELFIGSVFVQMVHA